MKENLYVKGKLTVNIKEFAENLVELISINNEEIRNNGGKINTQVFESILEYIQIFMTEAIKVNSNCINIEKFNEILKEILEALKNNDLILMSDMFEYEIIPEINKVIEQLS